METAADMTERHARLLGRLAELGMALAEDLSARALAAETPEDADRLASGFHKLSRSVRQSLALEVRLRRDAERARRELEVQAEAQSARPAARRRAEAKARLDRLIWTEAEDETTARFWDEGARRLLAEAEYADDHRPVEALVEDLAEMLRAQAPRGDRPGKPEQVEFIWKIIEPDGIKRDFQTGQVEPPQSASPTAPLAGEHLGAPDPPAQGEGDRKAVEGVEAHGRRKPIGLPGEFGPNGETGEHRLFNNSG